MRDRIRRAASRSGQQNSTSAQDTLLGFTKYTFPDYQPDPVHELIASHLDRLVAGEIKKLMIFAPPQHGKSELVSVRLPGYWLGHHPNEPVAIASYGADLAVDKSRQARAVVESPEYREVFPNIQTDPASRAVNRWSLAHPYRGGVWAGGVDGPVTGFGFGLIIMDDIIKDWAAAQSITVRNAAWAWWRGTLRTRLRMGGAIAFITTRWHEDDTAGRILNDQGQEWVVLRLPALAETQEERDDNNRRIGQPEGLPDPLGREPGEALAPARYDEETLLEIKSDVGSMVWQAEYQGGPRLPEGNRFKRDWFPVVDALPRKGLKFVRYWDKGGTQDGGTYTVGLLMALADDGLIYVVDVVRGQWSAGARQKVEKETADADAAKYGKGVVKQWLEQEPGSGGKESAEASIRNLAGHSVYADRPTGDKDTRLEPFAAQAEAGNVRLLRGAWNGAYIEEMIAIPNGTYRDQGDGSSGAYNKLAGKKPGGGRGRVVRPGQGKSTGRGRR